MPKLLGYGQGGDDVPPTVVGEATLPRTAYAQVQGVASPPLCVDGTWIYDLPADSKPYPTRRSESHWGTGTDATKYREGDTLTYDVSYVGKLGQAAAGDDDWHVIWQLHGPVLGQWPGPILGLNVRHGQVRLGGGDGHAGQNYSTRNYEWLKVLGPWSDDTPIRLKVTARLSTDPDVGWVSAWFNGNIVLNEYHPVAYSGSLMPGTFYAGQEWAMSRTGLYRGTQRGNPPKYRQVMTAKVHGWGA